MYSVRKQRMECQFDGPTVGQYPHRFTHEERFQYRVKVQPVAGRLEFSIRCVDTRLAANAARREFEGRPIRGQYATIAADPEDSARRSRLRAKNTVRLLALEMRIDRMFTFTIRKVGDPLPYDTVLKAWDLFRRSMERNFSGFRYIATPEKQQNGQWHIHAGTCGFANINNLRKCWLDALNQVLGRSKMLVHGADSPGNVNVTNKRPIRGDWVKKATRIAQYIAKYIGKSMEAAFNRKKYFHTYGVKITEAQRKWLASLDRDSAVVEVMRLYGLLDESAGVFVGFDIDVWRRVGCSAWFSVDVDDIPPPF
jgi:hypothetical protein